MWEYQEKGGIFGSKYDGSEDGTNIRGKYLFTSVA